MIQTNSHNVPTYVEFDSKTGELLTVTSYPKSENYIEVEFNRVEGIVNGIEKFNHYKVVFNTTSLMYELVNVYDDVHFEYNVNNSLHKIQESKEADIIICKNYIKKCWEIKFGKLFEKTLKKNNVTLNTVKDFSVVKKNDPFVLYRSLKFNLADDNLFLQFDDTDAIIDFDVYTNKMFNSYGVEVVKD